MHLLTWKKAFDRVPREVVRWALRQSGVEEWLVKAVMAMYEKARTVVWTKHGCSEEFEVKVRVHQGSMLSPLLSNLRALARRLVYYREGGRVYAVCRSVCVCVCN